VVFFISQNRIFRENTNNTDVERKNIEQEKWKYSCGKQINRT
jgi:hypothetical protein